MNLATKQNSIFSSRLARPNLCTVQYHDKRPKGSHMLQFQLIYSAPCKCFQFAESASTWATLSSIELDS
jgi:hypothetical protein